MASTNFNIGDGVSFQHDGLRGVGTILTSSIASTVIVLLNEDCPGGWTIDSWEIADRNIHPKYLGMRGWHVPVIKLKPTKTKLGNEL